MSPSFTSVSVTFLEPVFKNVGEVTDGDGNGDGEGDTGGAPSEADGGGLFMNCNTPSALA